ncbi:N-acetylmuramoyl-L-alanine amidase [Shouchella rhizosphaerae]|uniref:N-acetylmuramoyl-L-alanine amidase n=1 Tax=Shouchella rhizosphaerae TaxID=866786 RepID=UPI003F80EF01
MTKIFIDPGHGGSDPGAVGNGLKEKDLVLTISRHIRDMLLNEYKGVEVKMSRDSDVYPTFAERANMANDWGADYFCSVHINAAGGTGFETFIHNSRSTKSVAYQNIMHPAILGSMDGVRDRGKKDANFAVLRLTNMPAILTENLFIDNANDAAKLKDPAFLTRVARGHVNGLAQAFRLKRKSGASEPDANKPEPSKPKPSKPKPPASKGDQKTTSLVDYLKSIGVDSSYANRARLAQQHGIKNYEGTAAQNTQLLNILRGGGAKTANSKPKPSANKTTAKAKPAVKKGDQKTNSVVDYLKSIGVDSSFANRKKLAAEYGIKNYTGSAAQNELLLKKLRG